MKQLLLILSILLTCTAAQAQRYRVVADSTFDYSNGKWMLYSVMKYKYTDSNAVNGRSLLDADTIYSYKPVADSLYLMSVEVCHYSKNRMLLRTERYEQLAWVNGMVGPVSFDDTVVDSLFMNGEYVRSSSELFYYKGRRLKKRSFYCTSCAPTTQYMCRLSMTDYLRYRFGRLKEITSYTVNYDKPQPDQLRRFRYDLWGNKTYVINYRYYGNEGVNKGLESVARYYYKHRRVDSIKIEEYSGVSPNRDKEDIESTQYQRYTYTKDRAVDSTWSVTPDNRAELLIVNEYVFTNGRISEFIRTLSGYMIPHTVMKQKHTYTYEQY